MNTKNKIKLVKLALLFPAAMLICVFMLLFSFPPLAKHIISISFLVILGTYPWVLVSIAKNGDKYPEESWIEKVIMHVMAALTCLMAYSLAVMKITKGLP